MASILALIEPNRYETILSRIHGLVIDALNFEDKDDSFSGQLELMELNFSKKKADQIIKTKDERILSLGIFKFFTKSN